MTILVSDDGPINKETEEKIRDIFRESECPNESLKISLNADYDPSTREVVINKNDDCYITVLKNVEIRS